MNETQLYKRLIESDLLSPEERQILQDVLDHENPESAIEKAREILRKLLGSKMLPIGDKQPDSDKKPSALDIGFWRIVNNPKLSTARVLQDAVLKFLKENKNV